MTLPNENTRTRSGLRVPPKLNNMLIERAQQRGISKNALILETLWKLFELSPRNVDDTVARNIDTETA